MPPLKDFLFIITAIEDSTMEDLRRILGQITPQWLPIHLVPPSLKMLPRPLPPGSRSDPRLVGFPSPAPLARIAMLLVVHQRLVNALRACLEVDLLMDGLGHAESLLPLQRERPPRGSAVAQRDER